MSSDPAGVGARTWSIALHFLLLSVLAVGGVNAVTPEIHRQVVEVSHWMSGRETVNTIRLDGPHMQTVATTAPSTPPTRQPTTVAISMLGPGVAWATANSSENSRPLIQWLTSTT